METTMLVLATDKRGQSFNTKVNHNMLVEPVVKENIVVMLEDEQT